MPTPVYAKSMSLLSILGLAVLVWSGTLLSRSFVTDIDYSPFWPVSGFAFALALIYGWRWALFTIPIIAMWAVTVHWAGSYEPVLLASVSCLIPVVVGNYLRKKLLATNRQFELNMSAFIQYTAISLLLISLPSALLSSLTANLIGIYSDVEIMDLALIYWLSEFAGIVLFFPLLLLPAINRTWLTENQSKLTSLVLMVLIGVLATGYLLPGLYKQIVVFICLPLLSYYALNEKNPWHIQLTLVLWIVLSLFVISEVPQADGLNNNVLFVSGFMLLFIGCVVTLHIIWLVSNSQRQLTEDLRLRSLQDARTHFFNHRGLTEFLESDENLVGYGIVARIQQSKEMIESMGLQLMPILLKEVANRIQKTIDGPLTIGVIGGSSLVVLVPKESGYLSESGCSLLFKNITTEAYLTDKSLSLREIDLAVLDVDGSQQVSLLENLVVAAHVASQNTIIRIFYGHAANPDLQQPVQEFRRFQKLKQWLDQGQLEMWGQSIVAMNPTDHPEKMELLARIRKSDGSIIMPGEFMPLVEKFGFQTEFDKYVLAQSFRSIPENSTITFTINVSAQFFAQPNFADFVIDKMRDHGIKPSAFSLEITESDSIPNIELTRQNLKRLNAEGVMVGLDDFGTGFATHSYLLDIQFNFVKIDGRFIKDILISPTSRATVESIVTVANSLKMLTVAEFVEDDKVLVCLRELGVHYVQGYAIGKPAPLS